MDTQEVRAVIRLEVDLSQDKKEILAFLNELISTHTSYSTTYNRMMFKDIVITKIEEESEIYKTN